MEIANSFIIYLIVFRLAIIITGLVSIILGYYLFIRGVWPQNDSQKGTEVDAKIVGTHLSLKNAAPGTCFAMFGVLIIAVMIVIGSPEMTLKTIEGAQKVNQQVDSQNEAKYSELYLRSIEIDRVRRIFKDYQDGYISADTAVNDLFDLLLKEKQ